MHYATSIKLEALRQLGKMLDLTPKATGGTAQRTRFQKSTELDPPTLAEMGLEAQNHAAAISLLAKRKAGEFLAGLEKSKGGNPNLSIGGQVESPFAEAVKAAEISRTCSDTSVNSGYFR